MITVNKATFMGVRIRESICPNGAHYRKFTAVADAINLGPGFLFIAEIKKTFHNILVGHSTHLDVMGLL